MLVTCNDIRLDDCRFTIPFLFIFCFIFFHQSPGHWVIPQQDTFWAKIITSPSEAWLRWNLRPGRIDWRVTQYQALVTRRTQYRSRWKQSPLMGIVPKKTARLSCNMCQMYSKVPIQDQHDAILALELPSPTAPERLYRKNWHPTLSLMFWTKTTSVFWNQWRAQLLVSLMSHIQGGGPVSPTSTRNLQKSSRFIFQGCSQVA